jgi:hypothetical protein
MNNMRKLLVCAGILLGVSLRSPLYAQAGGIPTQADPCSGIACQVVNTYNGVPNLTVSCKSPAYLATGLRARISVAISAISQANPAVITATGHGFTLSTRPMVTITGVTGAGYSNINATFVATIIDTNTFSVPFNSGALGAPTTTGTFTTTAPRSGVAEWWVTKFLYDMSNNLVGTVYIGGVRTFSQKCTDGASTTVNLQ